MLVTVTVFGATVRTFMANPARTGKVNDIYFDGFDSTPLWVKQVFCSFRSSAVTYRGYVYICGTNGSVWCFNAVSGDDVWQYSAEGDIVSTPVISSNTVVAASSDGNIYGFTYDAFDDENEEPRWIYNTGSYLYSSPVLIGNEVYILTGYPEEKIIALNIGSGSKIKEFSVSNFGFSSIATDGNYIVVGTNDGKWHCFDKSVTDSTAWTYQADSSMRYASATIDDGKVYIPGCGKTTKVFCLDLASGGESWATEEIDKLLTSDNSNTYTIASSIALDDDRLYINYDYYDSSQSKDLSKLVCVAKSDGNVVWVSSSTGITPKGEQISSPVISDDYIYFGSGDGYIYVLDKDGNIAKKFQLSQEPISSTLCLSNGRLYVGSDNFYCFKATTTFHITEPYEDEPVYGVVQISGTVKHPVLTGYVLEYKKQNEEYWVEITSGTDNVEDNLINSWDTTDLDDGIYTLGLRANIESSEDPYSAQNQVEVNNPPLPASDLSAADNYFDDGTGILLNWTKSGDDGAGDNDVVGYKILRGTTTENMTFLTQVDSGNTFYMDSSCTVYTEYNYKVQAVDGLHLSDATNPANAIPELDGFGIDVGQGATITLQKDGLSTQVVVDTGTFSQKVWIGIKISTNYTQTTIPETYTPTDIVREFTIYPDNAVFLKPATLRLYYSDTDVQGLTEENLRIFRLNNGVWNMIVNSTPDTVANYVEASVTSFSFYRIMEYTPAPGSQPQPPLSLQAADTPLDGGGSITLTWQKSGDDGSGGNDVNAYKIYRSTDPNVTFDYITFVSSGVTSYIDTERPVYQLFYYKLTASAPDSAIDSQYSNQASAYSEADGMFVSAQNGDEVKLVANGLTTYVLIEPNGLSNDAYIGIKIPSSYPELLIPASADFTDIVREFTINPSTTQFLRNLTIKIPYGEDDIADKNEDNMRIYWGDETKGSWRIVNTSEIKTEENRVWAVIPHFSYYRIMEYIPGREGLLSKDMVYTYPNPAKGDWVYFKFYLGDKADVTIDVYNVAGELIAHMERQNVPAGIFSTIEWDISHIASGAYIYRIKAQSASGKKAIKKKMAIIH